MTCTECPKQATHGEHCRDCHEMLATRTIRNSREGFRRVEYEVKNDPWNGRLVRIF